MSDPIQAIEKGRAGAFFSVFTYVLLMQDVESLPVKNWQAVLEVLVIDY